MIWQRPSPSIHSNNTDMARYILLCFYLTAQSFDAPLGIQAQGKTAFPEV